MGKRTDLQTELETLLGSDKVYFQPPSTIKISYPCIIYELADVKTLHANNKVYKTDKGYKVTLIHKDPDNDIVDKLIDFPKSKYNNSFTSDNLNHYVFTIFY